MYPDQFLTSRMDEQPSSSPLSQFSTKEKTDFSTNDYLGIRTNQLIQQYYSIKELQSRDKSLTNINNSRLIQETENMIAEIHNADAALFFNSGYSANLGIMSAVPQRGDTIFYDSQSHPSIRDGIRLCMGDAFAYEHNDLNDLDIKLKKAKGNIFVITESVFPIDGELAPLSEMAEICNCQGAHLVVDESHAIGVIGGHGLGLVQELRLESRIFARTHSFGKAMGTIGAVILGSDKLKKYLINFARPFIFSTCLSESAIEAIRASYQIIPTLSSERERLFQLILRFQTSDIQFEKLPGSTPIQGCFIRGNHELKSVTERLKKDHLDTIPVSTPTVPKGKERLLVHLHSFNTMDELRLLTDTLNGCNNLNSSSTSSVHGK